MLDGYHQLIKIQKKLFIVLKRSRKLNGITFKIKLKETNSLSSLPLLPFLNLYKQQGVRMRYL